MQRIYPTARVLEFPTCPSLPFCVTQGMQSMEIADWKTNNKFIDQSIPINNHMNLCHRLVIDYQYQAIN